MKKYLIYSLVITSLFASCGKPVKGKNGITYKSAVQYNDYIVTRQSALIKNVIDFSNIAQTNLDSAEAMLVKFGKQAGDMIEELKGMPAYKGDSSLRDAAVSSFGFYKKVFEKDYMDVLQIKKKAEQTSDDQAEIASIIGSVSKDEEGYDLRFHEAQLHYAEKNNMKLTDNKMQKELDKLKPK